MPTFFVPTSPSIIVFSDTVGHTHASSFWRLCLRDDEEWSKLVSASGRWWPARNSKRGSRDAALEELVSGHLRPLESTNTDDSLVSCTLGTCLNLLHRTDCSLCLDDGGVTYRKPFTIVAYQVVLCAPSTLQHQIITIQTVFVQFHTRSANTMYCSRVASESLSVDAVHFQVTPRCRRVH